jgi:hypothetical protein
MFCEMNNLESLLENCGAVWDLSKGSVDSLELSLSVFPILPGFFRNIYFRASG